MMQFRIREKSWLARIAARKLKSPRMTIVVGHTIYLHGVSQATFLADEKWLRHELAHIAQYERYGTTGFLLRYLYESMKHGYRQNRFEAEARAAEDQTD
jgi:hypothetical protein